MGWLIVGLIIFFGTHSVSLMNEPWRNRMAGKLGEGVWKGLYSILSLIGLGLLIWGFGQARHQTPVVYVAPFWLVHLTMLLMVPVFPLLLATYFPGHIKQAVRHPMLVAVLIWASAHLLVNGRVTDLLLFGSFLLWAALGLLSMRWRTPRPLPSAPSSRFNDALALVAGIALYGLFLVWLHALLIGVPLLVPIS